MNNPPRNDARNYSLGGLYVFAGKLDIEILSISTDLQCFIF